MNADDTLPPPTLPPRKYGGPSGYGHVPDPEGHAVTSFSTVKARLARGLLLAAALPLAASMRQWLDKSVGGPGIFRQGQTSSCTGQATIGACQVQLAKAHAEAGLPPPEPFSPEANYGLSRCIDRVPDAAGNLPELTDDGASPNQNMRALSEWGAPTIAEWGKHPADPETINDEPPAKVLEECAGRLLDGYYRIDSEGDARVLDVMRALAAGFCITFAIEVDQTFEDYEGGVFGATDASQSLGGHDLYAIGYSWDGRNIDSVIVEIVNSWSETWGEMGLARCSRAFIDTWSAIYVMKIKEVA